MFINYKKQMIRSFTPAIVWFLFSAIILFWPGSNMPKSGLFDIPYFDKIVHAVVFFVLTTLLAYPFFKLPNLKVIQPLIIITILVIGYGVIAEFIQERVGRSFDVYDIIADAAGALISVSFFFRIYLDKKN